MCVQNSDHRRRRVYARKDTHTLSYTDHTGMDKTCLYTSSGSLFVSPDVGMSMHVERNNYVPLFGVGPIECRLTLLHDVIVI